MLNAELEPRLVPRVLPSARELAECHGDEELKHLRGVATSLGDTEVADLFAAASKERRRLEVERSLDRPRQWRNAELETRANSLTRRAGVILPTDYAQALGVAPEPFASAQSAGPSE